jgi:hypothetical protein
MDSYPFKCCPRITRNVASLALFKGYINPSIRYVFNNISYYIPYPPLIIKVDTGMFQLQSPLQVCSRRQDQRGNKAEDVSANCRTRCVGAGAGAGALVIARGVRAVALVVVRSVRGVALIIARGVGAVAGRATSSWGRGSHRGDGLAAGCNHLLAHLGRFRENLDCGRNRKSAAMALGRARDA